MALNGTAFAGYATRFAAFVAGETPDELVPVAGGDARPFVHDGRGEKVETTEAGIIQVRWLSVFLHEGDAPLVGDHFTWSGETWQVARVEPDRCAGADWPCFVELVGAARQVPS